MQGYLMKVDDAKIEQEILRQISNAFSVAPRDVAVAIAPDGQDWRTFLPRIKAISFRLHGEGRLILLRKRKSVSPDTLKGVYRLALPDSERERQKEIWLSGKD